MSQHDLAPVGAGASFTDQQRERPRREPVVLSAEQRRLWSEFGTTATDNQRINLRLGAAPGKTVFFNASQVMGGRVLAIAERSGLALTAQFAEALQAAATGFLDAAESIVDVHRTRLYVDPRADAAEPRRNGAILEWRDGIEPANEAVPLADFCAGQWLGLTRSDHPRYSATIATLMQQAATLAALLGTVAHEFHVAQLAIRTFDPADTPASAGPDAWRPQLG